MISFLIRNISRLEAVSLWEEKVAKATTASVVEKATHIPALCGNV